MSVPPDPTRLPPVVPGAAGAGGAAAPVVEVPAVSDMRRVLRIPAFRRLYPALALSSFGDWLGFLATTALATQLVDTFREQAFATSGVLVFRLLPSVLLGPLAGAFADRFDRRRTMVVCDSIRFALFLSIPLSGTLTTPSRALIYLFVASFLIESVSLFWIPAKEATIPNLVETREQLEAANQLSLLAAYGSAPVAALVFALLSQVNRALATGLSFFSTNPVDLALYFNAATFLFSALTVARLHDIPTKAVVDRPAEEVPGLLRSVREGFGFFRGEPLVRGLVVGMLGGLAAGGCIIATGRLYAAVLGGGDGAYGLLFGSVFLGLALGIALGPKVFGRISRRRLFGPSIVAAGAALSLMALVPNLFLAVVLTVLVGAFAGTAYVVGLTLLGAEVADELRGRTFGLVQSLMRVDLLVVTALAPFVVGAIGTPRVPLPGGGSWVLNGVSLTLLVGGLVAVSVGVVAYRQMDDRRGVPLLADVRAALRRVDPGPSTAPGLLVALEGGEGAGKSTQVRLLAERLRALGHEVVTTREPGGTGLGRAVRALLLDSGGRVSARAEALLYAADRAQHVAEVIRPSLAAGAVVLTDRYVDSSLAYQGAGRELSTDDVARLSRWATEGLRPDLTVILDVDPLVGLARVDGRGGRDRLEAEPGEFHQRVREGFLELAAREPERYLVLPAGAPPEVTAERIAERLVPLLAAVPVKQPAEAQA